MQSKSKFAPIYTEKYAHEPRLWEAVKGWEPHRNIIAVHVSDCDPPFEAIDYLRSYGVLRDVLDGTRVQSDQHCHAEYKETSSSDDFQMKYMMGEMATACGASMAAQDIINELQNGQIEFAHKSVIFRMYVFTYPVHRFVKRMYIMTWDKLADADAGKHLIAGVRKWSAQLRNELWVYNGVFGGWRKNKNFFASVQAADADDLILPSDTITGLIRDTATFFQSEARFVMLNITWKRGILLLGPPGNGKTGMIKLLAKQCGALGIPALYVQTPKTRSGPEYGMTAIFAKARREAPCMLILEDIESMVSGDMRTMMLNQLDGIESNHGVLIVASANDAAKLDPAIVQRPSRFDAKYEFGLPDDELRARFVRLWIDKKIGAERIEYGGQGARSHDELVGLLVQQTKDWSFAFLKELFMSLILTHAVDDGKMSVDDILKQVEVLQKQVYSKEEKEEEVEQK